MTKSKEPEVVDPTAPTKEERESNLETSEEDKSAETKCDNHPQRYGRNYTSGGAISVNLCDECTPPWFKDEEASL